MTSDKIKVAIVEDDPYVRKLLEQFVDQEALFDLVYAVESVEENLEALQNLSANDNKSVDVLIQDIGLPGISGLESIRLVKQKMPGIEILMFTVFDDANRIFKAFCAGASGYLLKNSRLQEIKKAILDIHNGMAAMSPSIAKKVVEHFQPKKVDAELTQTEFKVVECLTEGMSYKMVADRLQVSINTVRAHIRNIYRKLHVNSKSEVVAKRLKGEI
jgi:DNA-binding NarL/FixJ family response regulator